MKEYATNGEIRYASSGRRIIPSSPETTSRGAAMRAERKRISKMLGTHTADEWASVLKRYDWRCVRCLNKLPQTSKNVGKDHIVEIYRHGCDCIANIQPLCRACNCGKELGRDYRSDFDARLRVKFEI